MKEIRNIILLLSVILLSACNKPKEDTPPEDYEAIFGKAEIPEPEFDYDLMTTLPCNPFEKEDSYVYTGKEIKDKKRYVVTLKFWFIEREFHGGQKANLVNSDILLKYVDRDKKLKTLSTKDVNSSISADFENDKEFVYQFKTESGFPMFLGIVGTAYDEFKMKASIQAVSEDGLIETPKLEYNIENIRNDGASDQFTSCGTIILP